MVASDVWDRLKPSNRLAEKRIHRAVTTLGDDVVDRLMIFALHLLGGPAGGQAGGQRQRHNPAGV